jgi:hypothetical protein
LLAARTRNEIPYDPQWIASEINATRPIDFTGLFDSGLIATCYSYEDEMKSKMKSKMKTADTDEAVAAAVSVPVSNNGAPSPQEFLEIWNATGFHQARRMSAKRMVFFRERCEDTDWRLNWRAALERIQASKFCRGNGSRGWIADIDFFLRPDTVTKALEGKYDNRTATTPKSDHERRQAELGQEWLRIHADEPDPVADAKAEIDQMAERIQNGVPATTNEVPEAGGNQDAAL